MTTKERRLKESTLAKEIGERVAAWRDANDVRQERLAEIANLSQGAISRIERGLFRPSAQAILRLCRATGMPPNEILGWEAK